MAQIQITGHGKTPVTITRSLDEAPASIRLMRECGYHVTARVAPSTDISAEAWIELFQAESVLRGLNCLEYATYNED